MCGTATEYQRLVDAGPLSHIVINDFKDRLRALPKKEWPSAIEMQARNRAHEILSFYLPGDLYHTSQEFLWTMISMEFYKVFKPLFASSRPTWSHMALAKNTFLAETEVIYTRVLGTEDQRGDDEKRHSITRAHTDVLR
ncbi:hypothetical protein C7450_1072 [Chelatococcus asaccharovorans]|uniref:Uncharacterized protein n=2 Tax=Chelatococcus asaccharovorans TaxID=28210 RepID=A0A2V3U2K6_9HYPH|nr:hypothetical protein C7450_1072 [Chelatococcus asaccharovorans]